MMDSKMSFNAQISAVVKRSLKILGFLKYVSSDFKRPSTLVHLYESLLLPILTYCSSIWLPFTQTAIDELISIEHIFLSFVSRMTLVPMLFFNHDYTAIHEYSCLPSLRNIYLRNYYIIELLVERSISHNLRNPHSLSSQNSSTLNYKNFSSSPRLGQL